MDNILRVGFRRRDDRGIVQSQWCDGRPRWILDICGCAIPHRVHLDPGVCERRVDEATQRLGEHCSLNIPGIVVGYWGICPHFCESVQPECRGNHRCQWQRKSVDELVRAHMQSVSQLDSGLYVLMSSCTDNFSMHRLQWVFRDVWGHVCGAEAVPKLRT